MKVLAAALLIAGLAAAEDIHVHYDEYGQPMGGYGGYESYGGYGGHGHGYGYGSGYGGYQYNNDGYRIVRRSDPYLAPQETTYATCRLISQPGHQITGYFNLSQPAGMWGGMTISGEAHGVPTGEHGFHIHALGDVTEGCSGIAGHYYPNGEEDSEEHDGPLDVHNEAHELKALYADHKGDAYFHLTDIDLDLWGSHSIMGRAINIHKMADPNAGESAACCVIGLARGPNQRGFKDTDEHLTYRGYENWGYWNSHYRGHGIHFYNFGGHDHDDHDDHDDRYGYRGYRDDRDDDDYKGFGVSKVNGATVIRL